MLGTGPAIVTNGPPGAGKGGFQRSDLPPFQDDRGRFNIRHKQRFLPEDEEHEFEELRLQLEVAYVSDRNFIEEYYKRLFDTGMDQETLAYMHLAEGQPVANLWTEANLQTGTPTPSGSPGSITTGWAIRSSTTGSTTISTRGWTTPRPTPTSWSTTPTCSRSCPTTRSRTRAGTFSAGRFYTNHEIDMPLNIGNVVRVVPYVQGQAVGWTDQLGGGPLGHLPTGAMGRSGVRRACMPR